MNSKVVYFENGRGEHLQLLFYNLRWQKLTSSGFVYLKNLQPMNSKVAYIQPYYS